MLKSILSGLAGLAILAAAAHAQERQWVLDATDQDAFLVFGVPESDDAGFSIWCTIQSGKAKIFLPEASSRLTLGKPGTMELVAGDVSVKLQGETSTNEEAGTVSLEAEVETANPIFTAMEKADRLKVHVEGEEQVFPLIDADVEGLLKLCDKS